MRLIFISVSLIRSSSKISRFNFDLTILAALLAVIGYSLNDTIVVFDRVRENFRKIRGKTPVEVFNISLNQTLSRTLMTSFTTLLVLIALFLLGGEIIHGFSMALIFGVLIGTYSSIYIASPVTLTLGIKKEDKAPQAICPGQNISWFNREYSLVEMMHHFYDKQKTLTSKDRPHMFAKEIQMYVDYFDRLVKKSELNDRVTKTLKEFYENMKSGIEYCRTFSQKQPYTAENIESIRYWVNEQKLRLDEIYYQAFGEEVYSSI